MPRKDPFLADVTEFQAKPGTDCTKAFQDAADSLPYGGVVYLPGDPDAYVLTAPVWLGTGISLAGDGRLRSRVSCPDGTQGGLILSCDRWQPDATYRVDCSRAHDSSVRPHKWGVALRGNTFVQGEGLGVANFSWETTDQLTIELMLSTANGGPLPPNLPLVSLGEVRNNIAAPFILSSWDQPNHVYLLFRTGDQDPGATPHGGGYRVISFWLVGAPPWRITLQLDLRTATASAFVGNQRVLVQYDTGAFPAGLRFALNTHYPLTLGGGTFWPGHDGDIIYQGLRVSNTIRYGGPPSATDAQRYFTRDANTVCYFDLSDAPGADNRVTVVRGDGGVSAALHLRQSAPPGGDNTVRDLRIDGGLDGQGVTFGDGSNYTFAGLDVNGFASSLGTLYRDGAGCYPVRVTDCSLQGFHRALTLHKTAAEVDHLNIPVLRRYGVVMSGSSLALRKLFAIRAETGKFRSLILSRHGYGGNFVIDGVQLDTEGDAADPNPEVSAAVFDFERHADMPGTSLTAREIDTGTLGRTIPVWRLRDVMPTDASMKPATFLLDRASADADTGCVVLTDGPGWSGKCQRVAASCPVLTHTGKFPGGSNVAV